MAISIVITDQDHEDIKNYLGQFLKRDQTHFIIVREDMSHIFEIHKALSENRIICIAGDRYMDRTKCLEAEILGKSAKFPMGPFHLGSRLDVPVLFVQVMRESKKHYHLYARRFDTDGLNAEGLLREYVNHLEKIIAKYPLQWFNFYDFWDDID